MTPFVSVVLAEADPLTRAGLRVALGEGSLELRGEARDAAGMLATAASTRPDVCIVGASLPGGAIAAIGMLAESVPGTRSVLLSAAPAKQEFLDAIRAGARGYLRADMSTSRLTRVLAAVAQGEVAVPRHFTVDLVDELQQRDRLRDLVAARSAAPLTTREWEVLRLLGDSRRTGEIAALFGISEVTVRRHVSALLGKLGLRDRASAVRLLRSAA